LGKFSGTMNESIPGPQPRWRTVDSLDVAVFENGTALARFAARAAAECLRAAIEKQGTAAVIFATGNSQLEFLRALEPGVNWGAVTAFHMDEYLGLPAGHPAAFRRYIHEKIGQILHPARVHYLEGDALEPAAECDRYSGLLTAQPIDLCCLGIGENGHLAFNDPPVAHFEDARKVNIVALDQACRLQQVGEGHFPNLDTVPSYALTLTIPMLCSARRMICIAPEARKARAVRDALTGPISTTCPASYLRSQPQAVLLLDPDSAAAWLRT
jgi:glucosamine-6-phosphate deaminase